MSLTVTQRPDQHGSWVTAKNPVLYKMTRKDYTWTLLVTSAGNTSIRIATDVTASFVAGDTIWLESDDGAYSATGSVVSSAYGTYTTVVTDVPYVADNVAGYINTITQRANYYVANEVYKDSDDSLIGTVNYYPTKKGLLTIDVSQPLLSVLDAQLPSGQISTSLIIDSTIFEAFYIKFTEVWTGSSESPTDDSGNVSYAVLGAQQIGSNAYLSEGFITSFDKLKILKGYYYSLSFLDTTARTDIYLKKSWYLGGQLIASTFTRNTLTPGKQIYTYFQKLLDTSTTTYWAEPLSFIINTASGTAWTLANTSMSVTLATGNSSKIGSSFCFIPTGSTVQIDWSVSQGANSCTMEIFFLDSTGTTVSSSTISTTSGTHTGTTTITPASDVYFVGYKASNSSGGNVNFTINSSNTQITNSANQIIFTATNIPAATPFVATDFSNPLTATIECITNPITLFWRNNLCGESSWSFGYNQDQIQKLQDQFKNKQLTLYDQNLTIGQFNALNELFSLNQIYQTPMIELTTSIDKTEARVGQQVYMVDSLGNKTGVIVLPGENRTMTKKNRHNFQVTIELPEIFG